MQRWQRTYWVVFAANLVTAAGMMSFLPFFPALVEELGIEGDAARARWAGVLFGAAPLSAAIMGPVWGAVGDRYGRKLMVVRALLAITVFVGGMFFVESVWQLLCLRLGQGIFSGFVPPSLTLVSVVTPREIQGRVTGTLQAALPAGMVTGPLIGAWIGEVWSLRAIFLFVAAASGVSALLVALFAHEDARLRATIERFSPTTLLAEAWRDLGQLVTNPRMRSALTVLFVVQFAMGATNPLLQLLVEDLWSGAPERVEALTAMLFSAFAIVGILATPLWGRLGDRIGFERTLLLASLLSALLLGLHALAPVFVALLVLRIGLGITTPGSNTAAFGLATVETQEERRGSALGAVFSARAFAVSLGATFGGMLAALFGLRALFLVLGLVIGAVLFVRFGLRRSAEEAAC